jgi:hypothetical protein
MPAVVRSSRLKPHRRTQLLYVVNLVDLMQNICPDAQQAANPSMRALLAARKQRFTIATDAKPPAVGSKRESNAR